MSRHTTAPVSAHIATFWESLERALGGFSLFFANAKDAESGLQMLEREADRIRLQGRHWLS